MTMETFLVSAPNIVLDEPKEIIARNSGYDLSVLGESAYSVNRFVFVYTKENFHTSDFLLNSDKTSLGHPHISQLFCELRCRGSPQENELIQQGPPIRKNWISFSWEMPLTLSPTISVTGHQGSTV